VSRADYLALLERRAQLANAGGFEPTHMPDHLFDFQRVLVDFAVRHGRAGMFADCGMGKTAMSLAWARNVTERTGKPVLFLTPLAVGQQVTAEADRFGYDAAQDRTGTAAAPITVTNYEQLGKFTSAEFGGVVCDESSILKSFDGTTRAAVTEFMRLVPYRLLATATAAPNDYTELGTSSEALGGMGHMDMLGRFFINKDRSVSSRGRSHFRANNPQDGGAVKWRLKGHAEEPFWRWVASWARAIRKPSDYGFDDHGFVLPDLLERVHVIEPRTVREDSLFDMPAVGLQEEREENRRTMTERCEAAATALQHADAAVAWCHLNDESTMLSRLIDGAVELTGSDPLEAKEEKLTAFSRGEIRVLVTKPSLGAWGLNWQHAHHMTYFPSHSYEQMYQAVRRMWRFGQTRPVEVDVITTPGGRNVLANLHHKAARADAMFTALVAYMNDALAVTPHTYNHEMRTPTWLSTTSA
jgi:hypothetical protein